MIAGHDDHGGVVEPLVEEVAEALVREQKRRGRHDDTVYVFTADNGVAWGIHRLPQRKGVPYATPIPLVFSSPKRWGDEVVAIDGKTLRGTIPKGESQGVHLLAAYLPREGIVLMQVEVDGKENEIVAAPRARSRSILRSYSSGQSRIVE